MAEAKYVFDADQVKEIRHALLVGLTCYGEIERLINARDLCKLVGEEVPENLCALHPTGAADTTSRFATALCYLEHPSHREEA